MSESGRVGLVLAAFFAASAVSTAYLPLWFTDQGLRADQVGFILGLSALLRVATVPIGGWAADRLGRRDRMMLWAALLATASACALPALGGVAALLAAMALLGTCTSLLPPLTDSLTLALAGQGRLDYGRTRAWGSVAYMGATAGAGLLLARTGTGPVPWVVAGCFGLAALSILRLPRLALPPRATGVAGPLASRAFRLALLATALVQGSHAAYYAFAQLHWRAAGFDDGTIGLLIAEGIVAEIALFVWGRRLIEGLGPARLTALAAAACLVRWAALAFVTDMVALAVLQLLHAATFACQHLSAMLVLRRLPPERASMAQTLLSALGFSLPSAALVWLTGQLYAGWGGLVFLPMAAIGGAALFVAAPLGRAIRV